MIKLPKYIGRWNTPKTGGHIFDRKNRTNNYQDMVPVTNLADNQSYW